MLLDVIIDTFLCTIIIADLIGPLSECIGLICTSMKLSPYVGKEDNSQAECVEI